MDAALQFNHLAIATLLEAKIAGLLGLT